MKKVSLYNNVRLEQKIQILIFALLSWDKLKNKLFTKPFPPILAMKKLEVLLLVNSIEYFDHLLAKNYAGNGFEKSLFFNG